MTGARRRLVLPLPPLLDVAGIVAAVVGRPPVTRALRCSTVAGETGCGIVLKIGAGFEVVADPLSAGRALAVGWSDSFGLRLRAGDSGK